MNKMLNAIAALGTLVVGLLAVLFILAHSYKELDKRLDDTEQRLQRRIETQNGQIDSLRLRLDSLATRRETQARWVTRAALSETKRPQEMRVVAHTIRNRYEREWRGADTYREVVLDRRQFSAFREAAPRRQFYRTMTAETTPYPELWQTANRIARRVVTMPRDSLMDVTHFLHPGSLDRWPRWTARLTEVPSGSKRMKAYTH